jgi:hypothetical protein
VLFCSSDWPRMSSNSPASQVLGLQVCLVHPMGLDLLCQEIEVWRSQVVLFRLRCHGVQ